MLGLGCLICPSFFVCLFVLFCLFCLLVVFFCFVFVYWYAFSLQAKSLTSLCWYVVGSEGKHEASIPTSK